MKTNTNLRRFFSTTVTFSLLTLTVTAWAQPAQNPPKRQGEPGPIPRADPGTPPADRPVRPEPTEKPQPPKNAGLPRPPALPATFILPEEFRTEDGSTNNLDNADWGTPNKPFIRLTNNNYADGVSEPSGAALASARTISNAVADQEESVLNHRGASDFLWQWGQFLDHDLTETPTATPTESFPILVPTGDPEFDPTSSGTVTMGLSRSAYEMADGVREQKSAITAWIDASQVYGSDSVRADALRANDGTGRLKVSTSDHGDLLPFNTDDLPNVPSGSSYFVAGDVRVNEQVGLIAIHTLFMREHNYWADLYRASNTEATDEEIYQFARMIVAAEMQAITYREFLPILLGPGAMPRYRGYKPEVDPTISNEFATAAYRLGHSLLSPTLLRLDAQGQEIVAGNLSLAECFFQPQAVIDEGIDVILRGMATQQAQELDEMLVDDVRNFLFGAPGSGGLDLAALNIQRSRDHGLASLASTRLTLGLPSVTQFEDINRDPLVIAKLQAAYASPEDVELWIGGLSEKDRPGAMVGPTFQKILVDQFTRLRDGDRFWYQNYLPRDLIRLIERQSLSTIIQRNTEIKKEISKKAFMALRVKKTAKKTS